MKNNETNTQFISRIMDFSKSGAMAQLVVLTAVEKYVEQCVKNPDATKKTFHGSFINGEAWLRACREIHNELKDRYEPKS